MTHGHVSALDHLLSSLEPLRHGQTVKLVVEMNRRHGRKEKRVQLGLLLAPGIVYGLDKGAVVVSLLDSGSCVVFPRRRKGVNSLVLAGLPARLANELMEKLYILYGE